MYVTTSKLSVLVADTRRYTPTRFASRADQQQQHNPRPFFSCFRFTALPPLLPTRDEAYRWYRGRRGAFCQLFVIVLTTSFCNSENKKEGKTMLCALMIQQEAKNRKRQTTEQKRRQGIPGRYLLRPSHLYCFITVNQINRERTPEFLITILRGPMAMKTKSVSRPSCWPIHRLYAGPSPGFHSSP